MPFIEICDFGGPLAARKAAARDGSEALVQAFGISPDIITCYFHDSTDGYAHAGRFGDSADKMRIFVRIHAFRRETGVQNQAAMLLTKAFEAAYQLPRENIAVYFVEREMADAYHGGISASDANSRENAHI